MSTGNFRISVEFNEDGIFITVKNPPDNAIQLRALIEKEIVENKIKNVDRIAVDVLIKGKGPIRRQKVSSDVLTEPIDEEIGFEVNSDGLACYIYFIAPQKNGSKITLDDIMSALDKKGIVIGIDIVVVRAVANNHEYNKKYLIAKGLPAVNGEDGSIEYFFDHTKKKLKPVILDSGNVDYYNIDNFEGAEEGQVLARLNDSKPGKDGLDIYGKVIKYRPGLIPRQLIAGKNISLSDDGKTLIADLTGRIIYLDGRISVSEIIEISGDVGPQTGNIDFTGTIRVFGNVLSEYSIIAGGNIEISGTSQASEIKSDGDVIIVGGVNGMNKSIIKAKGIIKARFISNASLFADGNIYTDNLLRCKVKTKGAVELQGKYGTISGGLLYAKQGITAKIIGSPMATYTELNVGLDYEIYEEYLALKDKLNKLNVRYDGLTKNIEFIKKQETAEVLYPKKHGELLALKHSRNFYKEKIDDLKLQIAEYVRDLERHSGTGYIKVTDTMHSGVRVQIGNAVVFVKDEIHKSLMVNPNGIITIMPLDDSKK